MIVKRSRMTPGKRRQRRYAALPYGAMAHAVAFPIPCPSAKIFGVYDAPSGGIVYRMGTTMAPLRSNAGSYLLLRRRNSMPSAMRWLRYPATAPR